MIAYKFLSSGATGLFSRFVWPTPTADGPGEWVRVEGELEPCLNAIHACTRTQLVEWLDDELWEIELDGALLEADGELVAPAGRLIRRVESWNDEATRAFVDQCVESTVALAAESLVQAGREAEAEALAEFRSRPDGELKVLQLAQSFDDDEASPVQFLADVIRLERGGRPELDEEAPTAAAGGPTPAALAANLGFVCAHIVAQLAEQERPGAYEASFADERMRQSTWLAARL
jgi:hypothetical protein